MRSWRVSWALFDLNGTLLDPSGIAEPLGGGAEDRRLVRDGERLARDLGAQLETVSGGKHFMPENHPREVAATIRRVVERGA
jgi:pimeloyl-ACP methyl ester carboxylesterase